MKMLLTQIKNTMMLALFISATSLFAQETPNQSYDLGAKINEMTLLV